MFIKAVQKYTRQTPRKVRLVANAVKDLPLEQAMKQLGVIEKKATDVVAKTIRMAIADATHNYGFQVSDLSIDRIIINEGPRYRRFRSVSRGRAHGIIKRTCHVTVVLSTPEDAKVVKPVDQVAPTDVEVTDAEVVASDLKGAEQSNAAGMKQTSKVNKANKVTTRKVTNRKVITGK